MKIYIAGGFSLMSFENREKIIMDIYIKIKVIIDYRVFIFMNSGRKDF